MAQALAASEELATDMSAAEDLLKRHHELRTEIDARAGNVAALHTFGQRLIGEQVNPPEVQVRAPALVRLVG